MAPVIDITITRGKTFAFSFLYGDDELLYKPITAMPLKAPCQLTVVGHGIPDGWPIQIQCVRQPQELNTEPDSPNAYYFAKVIDEDTIELNNVNAHCWPAFSGSGLVVFRKPIDLTGWQARATIRSRVGGPILFVWHSDPLELPDSDIVVDVALSCITLNMSAPVAAALDFDSGVYDAELIAPDDKVYALTAISKVTVAAEVTTP